MTVRWVAVCGRADGCLQWYVKTARKEQEHPGGQACWWALYRTSPIPAEDAAIVLWTHRIWLRSLALKTLSASMELFDALLLLRSFRS